MGPGIIEIEWLPKTGQLLIKRNDGSEEYIRMPDDLGRFVERAWGWGALIDLVYDIQGRLDDLERRCVIGESVPEKSPEM